MSDCNDCFSGCLEIHSDRCIKYTGEPIPELGICTNDTLAKVIELVADFLNGGEYAKYCNRMVPYEVVRYHSDDFSMFSFNGAGIGKWENIYICNGNNGTPALSSGEVYYIMYKPS